MSAVDPRFTAEGLVTIFLVLGGWTILFKDNPWCRLASNILMAGAAGNLAILATRNIVNLGLIPLGEGTYIRVIPIILGLLLFSRFYRPTAFLVRFPLSLIVGVGTGLMVVGRLDTMILKYLNTIATLFQAGQTPLQLVGNVVFIVTFITSLYFFIFSLPLTRFKPAAPIQRIGRYSLMIMLGLYFGATVMTRLSMIMPALLFMLLGIR